MVIWAGFGANFKSDQSAFLRIINCYSYSSLFDFCLFCNEYHQESVLFELQQKAYLNYAWKSIESFGNAVKQKIIKKERKGLQEQDLFILNTHNNTHTLNQKCAACFLLQFNLDWVCHNIEGYWRKKERKRNKKVMLKERANDPFVAVSDFKNKTSKRCRLIGNKQLKETVNNRKKKKKKKKLTRLNIR